MKHPTDTQKTVLACRKVRLGEVSRARHCLTGSPLAPAAGVAERTPPKNFQRVASAGSRVQPRHTSCFGSRCFPEKSQNCDQRFVTGSWRCSCEHLKVLMDDQDTLQLWFEAATNLAQATVPASVAAALTTARLTAHSKRDGRVRGIVIGCSFQWLVARTLAKQFAEDSEQECPVSVRIVHTCWDRLRLSFGPRCHRRQPLHHSAQSRRNWCL